MYKIDLIQAWLDKVALGHSGSENTESLYRYYFNHFLKFIDATADDIKKDYDSMNEREFKQKYTQAIDAWSSNLMRENYTHSTISGFIGAVRSFFKYRDFPLGFVPAVRKKIVFHNRDIEAAEIVKILGVSDVRERAFYTFMAQSGLRPTTICNLKLKNIEPDFSAGKIPCLVNVPEEATKGQYHEYISFIGEEAVRHLKAYFNTRRKLTGESLVFVNQGTEKPMVYNTLSSLFRKAVRTLREKGEMTYDQKRKDRPAEIRLYSLRKFFRKMAIQAGFENVEYWMGHTGPGVDAAYRPKDPEFYRKIYVEKAAPFLRLETATPSETEKQIGKLASENKALQERIATLESLVKSQIATEYNRANPVPNEIDRAMDANDVGKVMEYIDGENRRLQELYKKVQSKLEG